MMPAPYGTEGSRSGMGGSGLPAEADDHTAREEAEGKALWEKLQAKQITCAGLQDENFEALGEYFMGIMMGPSHSAMNQMMIQMMGEAGEEQMHLVMGKRLSGCDTSAAFSPQGLGFMPMMQMMWGARLPDGQDWSTPGGGPGSFGGRMMNWGLGSFAWLGVIFAILWILWWVLVIAGTVVLIRWFLGWLRGERWGKSALDILKERYAKGEIDQREFEEKKRGLTL